MLEPKPTFTAKPVAIWVVMCVIQGVAVAVIPMAANVCFKELAQPRGYDAEPLFMSAYIFAVLLIIGSIASGLVAANNSSR